MPRRRAVAQKQEGPTISDLLLLASKQLKQQATKPNILGYEPHHKQQFFHSMQERRRLYIGGNRSGKSYGSVAEDIWWASGTHPHIPIKELWPNEQIRGRVVAVDYERGVEKIIIPLFKSLCPPTYLRGGSWDKAWSTKERTLYFAYNDSFIEFMSYEQATEKFAGTSRHFIHFDEEPPKNIYQECLARLVDTLGRSWISMTPVEGMTWVYDDMYSKAEESEEKKVFVEGTQSVGPVWSGTIAEGVTLGVVEVEMNENPHLTTEAINEYLAGLDADDRLARQKGRFVQVAGKVFKNFSVETHVTAEDVNPKELQRSGWQIYTSTDHGWNAPTAWLWHAVAPEPDGQVITFSEHFAAEMTIAEHAAVVIAREEEWGLDRENIIRTGDPAMHQHTAVTGTTIVIEYAKHGLAIYTESIPVDRGIGIARMQEYFRVPEEGKPKWRISNACPNFIRELKNLRWKMFTSKKIRDQNNPQEQVHKKDDHAFDSAKYFATFLPELAPEALAKAQPKDGSAATMNYDEALRRSLAAAVDNGPRWEVVEYYR